MKYLLIALALCLPASATLTVVSSGMVHQNAGNVTTGSFNQNAGDLLYVGCFASTSTSASTVSSAHGDSFTSINSSKDNARGSNWYNTWYAQNVTAATGNTVTCHNAVSNVAVWYVLIRGTATASALDVKSGVTQVTADNQCTTGAITTTNASDIIIASAGLGQYGGSNLSWGVTNSFTIRDVLQASGSTPGFSISATRVVSSTGSYSTSLQARPEDLAGANWLCDAVAFKELAGGGPADPPSSRRGVAY